MQGFAQTYHLIKGHPTGVCLEEMYVPLHKTTSTLLSKMEQLISELPADEVGKNFKTLVLEKKQALRCKLNDSSRFLDKLKENVV